MWLAKALPPIFALGPLVQVPSAFSLKSSHLILGASAASALVTSVCCACAELTQSATVKQTATAPPRNLMKSRCFMDLRSAVPTELSTANSRHLVGTASLGWIIGGFPHMLECAFVAFFTSVFVSGNWD